MPSDFVWREPRVFLTNGLVPTVRGARQARWVIYQGCVSGGEFASHQGGADDLANMLGNDDSS